MKRSLSARYRPGPRGSLKRRPLLAEALEGRLLLSTITVTGTGDTIANDGVVTLREAITAANTNASSGDAPAGSAGLDTIAFNIPGAGVHTITVLSDLPAITEPAVIDGYTQPGASANTNGPGLGGNAVLKIEIAPNQARAYATGIRVTGGGSTVRGLVINGFFSGIDLQTLGGNTVVGNYLGVTPDGITQFATNGPVSQAIQLQSSNNTIGGTAPADRNVLSVAKPVHVPAFPVAEASNNVIQGNFLGTNAAGTAGIRGLDVGILIESGSGFQIGGTSPGAGNLISGVRSGITVYLGGPTTGAVLNSNGGHIIEGNQIGTDVTGAALLPFINSGNQPALGNEQTGIFIVGLGHFSPTVNPLPIRIGGSAPGAGNVISGSGFGAGISLSYPSEFVVATTVQGNFIGTDRTGLLNFGNRYGGINLSSNMRNVTVTGNVIAYNASNSGFNGGLIVPGGETGNLIVDNSIHLNGTGNPGIIRENTLGPVVPTLTSATVAGPSTTVMGTVSGVAGTTMRVDLYANAAPPAGVTVQGQTPVTTLQVPIAANGIGAFTTTFASVAGQPLITATATSPTNTTSPFSDPQPTAQAAVADLGVAITSDAPDPVAAGGSIVYTIVVSNAGPELAQAVSFTTGVPPGTTFVSLTAPAGWTATTPAVGGTGAITATTASLAVAGVGATFTLQVQVAGNSQGGSVLSLSAAAAATTTDLNGATDTETTTVSSPPPPPANTAPAAAGESYNATAGTALLVPVSLGVLSNDTDTQGDHLSAVLVTTTTHGALSLNLDGSFTYTGIGGYSGTDSFTYRASDGLLQSALTTVTFHVTAVPPPPPDTGDRIGPHLLALQRYGFHSQPTRLLLSFDEPLAPVAASETANYQLVGGGPDGRLGTRDDVAIGLRSAVYDAAHNTVSLSPVRLLALHAPYQLTVRGGNGGVSDLAGNGLDGGTKTVRFDQAALAGPVPLAPVSHASVRVVRGASLRGSLSQFVRRTR